MRISDKGLAIIKKYEGLRLKAYLCPAGVLTIGYGHTSGVTPGQAITQSKAEELLSMDVRSAEKAVDRYADHYQLLQNQYDALVSFTYNCGAGNLDKLCKNGNRSIAEIARSITAYNKGGGKVLPGLVRRRAEERELFCTPQASIEKSYYPAYIGNSDSLDEMLISVGANVDFDTKASRAWAKRIPIAVANGIVNYTGTAAQNKILKARLRCGQLVRV